MQTLRSAPSDESKTRRRTPIASDGRSNAAPHTNRKRRSDAPHALLVASLARPASLAMFLAYEANADEVLTDCVPTGPPQHQSALTDAWTFIDPNGMTVPSMEPSKGKWNPFEDAQLVDAIGQHGPGKWSRIAACVHLRTSKQCRERWCSQLDPRINKEPWNMEEDSTILQMYNESGSTWSAIAKALSNGRTDCAVKNRFYSRLQRDPRCFANEHNNNNPARACTERERSLEGTTRFRNSKKLRFRLQALPPKRLDFATTPHGPDSGYASSDNDDSNFADAFYHWLNGDERHVGPTTDKPGLHCRKMDSARHSPYTRACAKCVLGCATCMPWPSCWVWI